MPVSALNVRQRWNGDAPTIRAISMTDRFSCIVTASVARVASASSRRRAAPTAALACPPSMAARASTLATSVIVSSSTSIAVARRATIRAKSVRWR